MSLLRATLVLVLASGGCSGDDNSPSSPDRVTEAQVSSNGRWTGTFGERGTVSGPGTVGDPFIIGQGRQCATVRVVTGTTTIVRVGVDGMMTIYGGLPGRDSGTVCGIGLVGSR